MKGNGALALKASAVRRRTKAEVREAKLQEAARAAEIELKLGFKPAFLSWEETGEKAGRMHASSGGGRNSYTTQLLRVAVADRNGHRLRITITVTSIK